MAAIHTYADIQSCKASAGNWARVHIFGPNVMVFVPTISMTASRQPLCTLIVQSAESDAEQRPVLSCCFLKQRAVSSRKFATHAKRLRDNAIFFFSDISAILCFSLSRRVTKLIDWGGG